MIIPRLPQKASDQNGCGALKLTLTVWLSSLSIREISRYEPLVHAAVSGSATYSQLKTTSSAVKGLPSCQVTPFLSRHLTQVRSLARPPFWTVGTSAARMGTTLPSGSKPGRVLVLGAVGEVRVQKRGRLPPEDLELASAASPRRSERVTAGLRVGHAGSRQHPGGEGRGEPEPDHGGDERAAGEPTGPDVLEELAKLPFVHGERPPRSALPWQRSRAPHRALSMRTATSSASTMLSWFAMPFHARSNAVPWSTETRRNGSPTVTLTPESPTHRLVASS